MFISIRFCGGCNPRVNRTLIAGGIKEYLTTAGHVVVYNRTDTPVIICISGCTANCAEHGVLRGKAAVVIAGASVDGLAVQEDSVGSIAIKKVRDYLGQLEKPLST
ncbi:hypothetical protein HA075_12770 [bacterium BFN5]|nr:hypothetical protein HA075_12695 [bacterium BFN5]QJW46627.1 hypothetical protein HA075_12770 [bacterium BFN5]